MFTPAMVSDEVWNALAQPPRKVAVWWIISGITVTDGFRTTRYVQDFSFMRADGCWMRNARPFIPFCLKSHFYQTELM